MTTLAQLRHDVADAVHDLVVGMATGGSLTTLVDSSRWEPTTHWPGAELTVYSGTGIGQTRRVASMVASTTFVPHVAFATAPDATSLYELHRRFDVRRYNRAINRAITDVQGQALVDISDTSLDMAADTYEYALPASFLYVHAVSWKDPTDTDADWLSLSWWDAEWGLRPGRKLWIATPYAGYEIRVEGQRLPVALIADSDVNEVPDDFVAYHAVLLLTMSDITGAQNDVANAAQVTALAQSLRVPEIPKRGPRPGHHRVV